MELIFATHNRHKLNEVQAVLGAGFRLVTPQEAGVFDEIPETRQTLEGNAFQKADYLWERTRRGVFADDTGLEVEALDGAPGVYSARYSGPKATYERNNALLLANLRGAATRRARFRTVIALILPDGARHQFEGIVEGEIIEEPRGGEGFGYDPLFVPDGFSRTFAEMIGDEKNLISHRGRAVEKLASFLRAETVAFF